MRLFRYIITNVVFVTCLWFGIIHGISGAANISLLMAWYTICISAFFTNKYVIEAIRKNGRSVPLSLDQVFDALVLLFMVWHAWWITGIGYLFHMVMVIVLHQKAFGDTEPLNLQISEPPDSPHRVVAHEPMNKEAK